jgi:hypothetical protein
MVPLFLLFPAVSALTPNTFETFGTVTRFSCYGLVLMMLFLGPLAHYKSGSLTSLWSLSGFILYTRWFGALRLIPGAYLSPFQEAIGESLSPRNMFSVTGGKDISQEKIKTLGVESTLFVQNSEQLLFGLAAAIAILIVFSLLGKGEGESFSHKMKLKLQYSMLIVPALLCFQDLLIYAFLQMQGLAFSSVGEAISVLLGFAYLLFAIVFTLLVPIITCKRLKSLKSGDLIYCFKWRVLIEDMKLGLSYIRYQYYCIYLLQRWFASILYVFLDSVAELQIVAMLVLEALVLVWVVYARPYEKPVDNLCLALVHADVCLLLLFDGCFLLSWNEKEEIFLALAYAGAYIAGITICLARFAVNLYSKKEPPALEPQTAITDITVTELKSTRVKAIDDSDQIPSQKPSDPYLKMQTLTPPLKVKHQNKVVPMSPATPLTAVPVNTQNSQEDPESWVNRWSRFKGSVQ